jgi:hypothetical protein
MTRFLAFATVLAVALMQPVVTLGAPPGGAVFAPVYVGGPVYRPEPVRPATEARASTQDDFKIPIDLKVRPKPLPETVHPGLEAPSELDAQPAVYPSRWREWGSAPGYLGPVPLWYQPGCYANGGSWAPAASVAMPIGAPAPATNFSIGSLAGDRPQGLFSSPDSYSTDVGSLSGGAPAPSAPTIQYGLTASPCGAPNFIGL